MKSRKEQHKEEKSSSLTMSAVLMCFSGGAAFLNGNAAYITLNRDSAEYAIVRGTLNSGASWGSRPRGSFNHEDEQHEYTAPDCTLLRGLLFLVSLVWFLYLIRRKSQSSSLTLRKSGRQI